MVASRRSARRGAGPRFPLLALVLSTVLSVTSDAAAQQEARPVLTGQVRLADTTLTQGTVILHLVSPNESGEVDSTTVDAEGRFRFDLPRVPDSDGRGEIYFASIRHAGILYFGPAIARAIQLDSVYLVQVYDVEPAPPEGVSLVISTRNIFLEQPNEDGWRATDLFELRNDLNRTLVAQDGGLVWSYPLPAGATDFALGDASTLPDDAITFSDGRIELRAPLPPGDRVFVARYTIPASAFELPMPGVTEVMELLIREPAPPLNVDGLEAIELVSIEPGSSYRRYSGEDIQDLVVRLVEGESRSGLPSEWLTVFLILLLGGAGLFAIYRPHRRAAEMVASQQSLSVDDDGPRNSGTRKSLLLRVAQLDARLAETEDSDEAEKLSTERASLLATLSSMV